MPALIASLPALACSNLGFAKSIPHALSHLGILQFALAKVVVYSGPWRAAMGRIRLVQLCLVVPLSPVRRAGPPCALLIIEHVNRANECREPWAQLSEISLTTLTCYLSIRPPPRHSNFGWGDDQSAQGGAQLWA